MKQVEVLSRLLDKYEKSKHLTQPGTSNRRVMLQIKKNELPKYNYEDAQCRDEWNEAVKALEAQGLVTAQWISGRPVLSCVALNLKRLSECYQYTGRVHPGELARSVVERVRAGLAGVTTDWVLAWGRDLCRQAEEGLKVPAYCKGDLSQLERLLMALSVYDTLHGETITMRAFSSRCYQDTKTFEREVKDLFLRTASAYDPGLAEASEQGEMGDRERLAYLGIYARPELYELSGSCVIRTEHGEIDVSAAAPYGLALPSSGVDAIQSFDMSSIQKVIFIENKTNYDEFVLSELCPRELAVYHGGFLSPQKRKFFKKMAAALKNQTEIVFWADIDLGGFQMFEQLKAIFPTLTPMRMSAEDVTAHHVTGLVRSEHYLKTVRAALACDQYPLFHMAMKKILEYGVTIEQEVFLTEQLEDTSYYDGEEQRMTEVVAALIWDQDKFMICQRPEHKARGLLWEFVGGKVEPGETKEQALIRECQEELAVTLDVGEVFMDVIHEYPDLTVHLTLFHATIHEGIPQKLEHNDIRWITVGEIDQYAFCPADEEILNKLKQTF